MSLYQLINSKNKILLLTSFTILFSVASIFPQSNPGQLKEQVLQKISGYYPDEFDVTVDQTGAVTISGDVNTLFDKLKITELISRVNGVSKINNNIEIQTEPTIDEEIKANIEEELKLNNVILEPDKINVEVKNGVVYLTGTVSYFREKLMAQTIASWQDGVTDMKSSIKVLSPMAARSDDNLYSIINDILKNRFGLEDKVKFNVNDGVVDLLGSVKSLYAKDKIAEEIQQIIGVKKVLNELSVEQSWD